MYDIQINVVENKGMVKSPVHAMKACGGKYRYGSTHSLTSVLGGGEGST